MRPVRSILIVLLLMLSGAFGLGLSLFVERTPVSGTQERETFHSPATFVRQLEGDADAGRKIFQTFCATCHASQPQIQIEAPRIGDRKAWANAKRMGGAALLAITVQGAGAMPARGGCFECSDAQLKQAIDYIIKKSE